MNKTELEIEMKRHGDTGKTLSSYLGISPGTFSMKLNETKGAEFTQGEIMAIVKRYNLSPERTSEIFFVEKVS